AEQGRHGGLDGNPCALRAGSVDREVQAFEQCVHRLPGAQRQSAGLGAAGNRSRRTQPPLRLARCGPAAPPRPEASRPGRAPSCGSWGQTFPDLWGISITHTPQAWDQTRGGGVVIAITDTGIDINHEDIAANVWTNPGEIPGNGIDDDGNGYVDDVHGWNFVA